MNNIIYAVVDNNYDCHNIVGYCTNLDKAEKYCAANQHGDDDLCVEILECLDNTMDLSHIKLKYEYDVLFEESNYGGWWSIVDNATDYEFYKSRYLRSNSIKISHNGKILIKVNLENKDVERAKVFAQSILAEFLYRSNGPLAAKEVVAQMNVELHKEERERSNREKAKISKRELAELKRLKEKYESNGE